ncbi:hypothetical protein HDU76_013088 [Blyttiomyces sp. JEL0837]|nr:hypothetical protein HDU76_013088 [Blyttiomyces sp. JEL0837]
MLTAQPARNLQQQQAAKDIVAHINLIQNWVRNYATVLRRPDGYHDTRISMAWNGLREALNNFSTWVEKNQPRILAMFGPKIAIEAAADWTKLYLHARYHLEGDNDVVLRQAMETVVEIKYPIKYTGGTKIDTNKKIPVGLWTSLLLECCRLGNDAWFQDAIQAIKTRSNFNANVSTNEVLTRVGLVPAGREVNDGGEGWCRKDPITISTYPTLVNQLPSHRGMEIRTKLLDITNRQKPTDNAQLVLKKAPRQFRFTVEIAGYHSDVAEKLHRATRAWSMKSANLQTWEPLHFYMNKGLQVMISGNSKTSFIAVITRKGVDGDLYWDGDMFACVGRDINGTQAQFVAPAVYLVNIGTYATEHLAAQFSYIS